MPENNDKDSDQPLDNVVNILPKLDLNHEQLRAMLSLEMESIKEQILSSMRDRDQVVNRVISGLGRRVADVEADEKRHEQQLKEHADRLAVGDERMNTQDKILQSITNLNNGMHIGFQTLAELVRQSMRR